METTTKLKEEAMETTTSGRDRVRLGHQQRRKQSRAPRPLLCARLACHKLLLRRRSFRRAAVDVFTLSRGCKGGQT